MPPFADVLQWEHFSLTIDEKCAVELAMAIYAKATRMRADEVELFFGRFDAPPMH